MTSPKLRVLDMLYNDQKTISIEAVQANMFLKKKKSPPEVDKEDALNPEHSQAPDSP